VEQLVDLNPSLLRRTTPKDQTFDLHLPEGSKEKFETAIASVPKDKRVSWRYYKVQAGDSLTAVARRYHTTERAIAQVNSLTANELVADSRLVIPVSSVDSDKIRYSRYASHYKTHTGDTVLTVAEDFGVAPERLRRWNGLKGNELRRGRLLLIYKPLAPGEADKAPLRRKKTAHAATASPAKAGTATSNKETLNARTP
jgi:membrane-bound lytic murein transglycosylase D